MSIGRHTAALDPHAPPPPDADAVLAWAAAQGALLRGLVHALSNRVGTVAAVAGMLGGAEGAEVPTSSVGTAARVLAGEGERLDALLAHLRLATADPFGADAAAEPLHVAELVDAVAAAATAAGWDVAAAAAPDTPPALASRAAVTQALVVLLHAAGGAPAVLASGGDRGRAMLRVTHAPDGGAVVLPAAARAACAWLLGAGAVHTTAAEVRLPPLGAG